MFPVGTHLRRYRKRLLIGGVAILVVAVPALHSPAALANAYGTQLQNIASGYKCLDDTAFSKSWGTQMQVWSCSGGSNQAWNGNYINYNNSTELLKNAYSGLCLDVYQDSSQNGAAAVQWPCNPNDPAQIMHWTVCSNNNFNCITLQAAGTGTCLDDRYSGTANGTKQQFWQCNGSTAQQWAQG
jgi:hypothetical protein